MARSKSALPGPMAIALRNMMRICGLRSCFDDFLEGGDFAMFQDQRSAAASSAVRASTQRPPSGVFSFFQNGARVFR